MNVELPPPAPGLAKRHQNFGDVVALAHRAEAIEDMTYRRCEYALKRARPVLGISRAAHQLLLLLVDRLTAESWRRANYLVWPSNTTLADETGDSPRAVRGALSELERAGLITRWYTPANRRLSIPQREVSGGIDLAPLAARFLEIENEIIAIEQRRADMQWRATSRRQDIAGEEAKIFRLEQSPIKNPINTVTVKSVASPRNARADIHLEGPHQNNRDLPADPNCSPGGETGFCTVDDTEPTNLAEPPRAALRFAWELSPRLQSVVGLEEISEGTSGQIIGHLRRAVSTLLPQRNTVQSFNWLLEHHGWIAVDCLVAALEHPDPEISRSNWLGYFTKPKFHGKKLDFTPNLKKIADLRRMAAIREFEDDPKAPDSADLMPIWQALRTEVIASSSKAAWRNWYSQLRLVSIENGRLVAEVNSTFMRDQLRERDELRRVADRFGLIVDITLRKAN